MGFKFWEFALNILLVFGKLPDSLSNVLRNYKCWAAEGLTFLINFLVDFHFEVMFFSAVAYYVDSANTETQNFVYNVKKATYYLFMTH